MLKVCGGKTTGNKAELQARLDQLQCEEAALKAEIAEALEEGAGELPERTEGAPDNRFTSPRALIRYTHSHTHCPTHPPTLH